MLKLNNFYVKFYDLNLSVDGDFYYSDDEKESEIIPIKIYLRHAHSMGVYSDYDMTQMFFSCNDLLEDFKNKAVIAIEKKYPKKE
jgi:hypothetical protein